MKLIYRTKIYETDCKEHPTKYRFTENYEIENVKHFSLLNSEEWPHPIAEDGIHARSIIADFTARLGNPKQINEYDDYPAAEWYYRWTETSVFPGVWMLNIYLTTDEQYTYCILAFPPMAGVT